MNQSLFFYVLFFASLSSCATKSLSPTPQTEQSQLGFSIIDAHIHTRFSPEPDEASGIIVSQAELLKQMKENGVSGAIAHTGENGENHEPLESEGIIHCAGTGAKVDVKRIESGLKSRKYRCIKIYLGYVPQYAYSKNYDPAYRLAEKYQVPVVFHTGDTYGQYPLKYADPLTVDEVALKYPNVTFVIAHCGNPWIQSAAEVAYNKKNVYLDGSAFLIGDLSQTPPEKIDEFVVKPLSWIFGYIENPTKLMYATDWPLTDMRSAIAAFKRAIPREHWRAVFHDNAARVFKLPQ